MNQGIFAYLAMWPVPPQFFYKVSQSRPLDVGKTHVAGLTTTTAAAAATAPAATVATLLRTSVATSRGAVSISFVRFFSR